MKKLTMMLPLLMSLAACGGGGGGGSASGSGGTSGSTPVAATPGSGTPTTTPTTPATGTGTGTGTGTDTSTGASSPATPGTTTPGTGTPGTDTASPGTGSNGQPSTTTGSSNPQDKYVGTWLTQCNAGSRARYVVTRVTDDTVSVANSVDYYLADACTGPVIATLAHTTPVIATFTDTRDASVYETVAADAKTLKVDHFVAVSQPDQSVLSGIAVTTKTVDGHTEKCVPVGNAPFCVNVDAVAPAATGEYNLLLEGSSLYFATSDASQPAPINTWLRKGFVYTKQ